ncbi:hypothetical protein HZC32_00325 [Candidatus Woesearchaeota archaeon]|nr:hypothetical protein [Candidatus Woesearchaeota archaeon]
MNTQSKGVTELLVMLIMVVLTSGTVLLLVQSGIITVKAENEQVPILNAEFIPMGREGSLAVKEFQLCDYVDPGYNCVNEGDTFVSGSEVHFRFVVESSTYNGDIMLVENYRVKDSQGKILFDVDEKNNFHFDIPSSELKEKVSFKDYFVIADDAPEGEYSLELIVENPLLVKRTVTLKTFKVVSE